jgi:mRNA interferase YafQ
MERRGKDFTTFKYIIERLASGAAIEERYRDHLLKGNLKGKRDWVLIYKLTPSELVLVRTGTHADLFTKQ